VQSTTTRPKITVTADGQGVVSHAGSRLLADLADRTGLTDALNEALNGRRQRRSAHEPGRVLVDLAVMLADGGRGISGLAVLRDQPGLFGPVASTATAWRLLDSIDITSLAAIRAARAWARELRAARGDGGTDPGQPGGWPALAGTAPGRRRDAGDLSQRQGAGQPHVQGRLRLSPADGVAGQHQRAPRRGAAHRTGGRNTTADHITVTDLALAQIPDEHRHGTPILISADGAGATKEWLTHLRAHREKGVDLRFSVGFTMTETVQQAIRSLPAAAWTPAIEADSSLREGADVAELTGLLPQLTGAGWPAGKRVIVRRERPHPGAQLRFTDHDGWRFQAFATDTASGQLAQVEARHRAHARVEDRIRCAKDSGLNHPPSRQYAINEVWLELTLIACDLLAWTQTTLLDGALATAEPRLLRYKLLHVAARITRGQRRIFIRIDAGWPWRHALAAAYARLQALPQPLS
jgi:hypothetical protein